jgi:DNA repair exonuclease SbcCD ATPase subunit
MTPEQEKRLEEIRGLGFDWNAYADNDEWVRFLLSLVDELRTERDALVSEKMQVNWVGLVLRGEDAQATARERDAALAQVAALRERAEKAEAHVKVQELKLQEQGKLLRSKDAALQNQLTLMNRVTALQARVAQLEEELAAVEAREGVEGL